MRVKPIGAVLTACANILADMYLHAQTLQQDVARMLFDSTHMLFYMLLQSLTHNIILCHRRQHVLEPHFQFFCAFRNVGLSTCLPVWRFVGPTHCQKLSWSFCDSIA